MGHKIGVIGGSGLERMKLLSNATKVDVDTPFGKPSAPLTYGKIGDVEKQVVLLPRHGEKHEYNPTNVPYHANVHALKEQGCTIIVSATAVGSLREELVPGDLVLMDQFIDRTVHRKATFYSNVGQVCHIPMAEPFCATLRGVLQSVADQAAIKCHNKGTVVTIEGPRFSTRAESFMFRQWGCDLVGMTASTEASLAREAGLHYVSVAMVTDYDCWRDSTEDHVSVETVMAIMKKNGDLATRLISLAVEEIASMDDSPCPCAESIKKSLM